MSSLALRQKLIHLDAEATKRSRVMMIGLTFNVTLFVVLAFVFPNSVERIGSVLTAAGWLVVGMVMRRYGVGSTSRYATDPDAAAIPYQRATIEAEYQRAAAWPWLFAAVPGPVVFIVGITRQFPELARDVYFMLALLGVFVAAAVIRQIFRARQYRESLQELAVFERSSE
jgi:hypothetical protein